MKFIDENDRIIFEQYAAITETVRDRMFVLFRFSRLRNNWPMSAHASQAFSTYHCTDSGRLGHFRTWVRVGLELTLG